MQAVLEAIVGPWGKIFISIGFSFGARQLPVWSRSPLRCLIPQRQSRTMPSFLARENAKKVPAGALWLTNIVIQVFLLVTYFASTHSARAEDDELDDAHSLSAGRCLRVYSFFFFLIFLFFHYSFFFFFFFLFLFFLFSFFFFSY